jgi:hypothetical protein
VGPSGVSAELQFGAVFPQVLLQLIRIQAHRDLVRFRTPTGPVRRWPHSRRICVQVSSSRATPQPGVKRERLR